MIKTQLIVLMPQKLKKMQLTPPVADLVLEYVGDGGRLPSVRQINISDLKTVRQCPLLKTTKHPSQATTDSQPITDLSIPLKIVRKNSEGFHMNPAELTKCIHLFAFI